MAKIKSVFACQGCGAEFPKWQGQCPNCKQWNSLVETIAEPKRSTKSQASNNKLSGKVLRMSEVEMSTSARLEVGSTELSQVLGGGLVPGSVTLLAGEPGIGKSTLLSQLTLYFATRHGKVLYVCGEESPEQVKLRLERLSEHKKTNVSAKDNVMLMSENDTDRVVAAMGSEKPFLTIVDSIQTLTVGDLSGMAGSVGQVRESGNRVLNCAKSMGLSTFLVGHVTKDGTVAGPKVLEHMVDCVLQLAGERSGNLRILRAVKNRFGPVDEVAVYKMVESGLVEVTNPSEAFLSEAQTGVAGSCVTAVMEGTRAILTEVQALVVDSSLPTPRRVAEGISTSRLSLLCAILQKRAGVSLSDKDVFVNVAGGIKLSERASDLGFCLAIASSYFDRALPPKLAAFGEVGLLGEVRKVSFADRRVREAKKLGYEEALDGATVGQVGKIVRGYFGK